VIRVERNIGNEPTPCAGGAVVEGLPTTHPELLPSVCNALHGL
jgi:hypothetical protein